MAVSVLSGALDVRKQALARLRQLRRLNLDIKREGRLQRGAEVSEFFRGTAEVRAQEREERLTTAGERSAKLAREKETRIAEKETFTRGQKARLNRARADINIKGVTPATREEFFLAGGTPAQFKTLSEFTPEAQRATQLDRQVKTLKAEESLRKITRERTPRSALTRLVGRETPLVKRVEQLLGLNKRQSNLFFGVDFSQVSNEALKELFPEKKDLVLSEEQIEELKSIRAELDEINEQQAFAEHFKAQGFKDFTAALEKARPLLTIINNLKASRGAGVSELEAQQQAVQEARQVDPRIQTFDQLQLIILALIPEELRQ
jgi:hypothetical protein